MRITLKCYTLPYMTLYVSVLYALTFILGVTIGSFLNVVIYRLGSGMGLQGRSKCLSCGRTLTARMLVPLFSYVFQRGKCAFCRTKISMQYPAVELSLGLLFVAIMFVRDFDPLTAVWFEVLRVILEMIIWALLLLVFVYDLKHKIIPDRCSLLFAVFSGLLLLLLSAYYPETIHYIPFLNGVPAWIDWAAAPLIALPLALLWLGSAGRAMGLGDAKLAWGIGWFLGFSGGVTAVILSFWIAFIPSLVLLFLRTKQFTMKSEIPFAPFLVLGTLVTYLFGVDILSWTF